ncbi:MAG TPA: gephyrin-like molybdotransferase Glp [Acidimicrobiales bacterium]|nr:gephyrin-like molybdotransferase Glp [Acidimicrobiales bacterium]
MITLEEAQAIVLAGTDPKAPAEFAVADALGLILAEDVAAAESVPPFRNSAMDGYAVHEADVAGADADHPVRLAVIGTAAAGRAADQVVGRGEALRIMTGAPFPNGADAIAIVENTRTDGTTVEVLAPSVAGRHIRAAGEDVTAGQEVFAAGARLGPGHLGVLCSVGCQRISAVPRPVVGVLSTGDELVEGPGQLAPGQIRDSNRRTLISLLTRDGFTAVDLGIARDDESVIELALTGAAASCDAILTSGGVSMGDFDYVKAVLDRIGRMQWMQIAIRPAKPFAFGVIGGTPVFGLPGNPVSSMVSYELLARPGLRQMAGMAAGELHRRPLPGIVDDDGWRAGRDGRTGYVRVVSRFDDEGRLRVTSAGGQGSHQLYAMAQADALAVAPPGVDVGRGDTVSVLRLTP